MVIEHRQSDHYVTLSYCWGGPQSLELRQNRLAEYIAGIPVRKLPQTILDAFHITKRLGFRYIWIDSLCIVQDDIDDKAREISNMTTIYKHSTLTIIAANAQSVEEGFLGPREDFIATQDRIPFLCKDGTLGTVALSTSPPVMSYNSQDNPIERRAWTYQERLLASRVLIYSHNGLRFACRNGVKSSVEGTPWIESHREPSHVEIARNDTRLWKDLVMEYSKRAMSDPGDKLLAISGLARAHAEGKSPGDDYLAGVWRESIASDLLWESAYEKLSKDAADHHAPSWSWASTDSRIDWPLISYELSSQSALRDFKLLGARTVPKAGQDIYGQIDHGHLEVRGHVSRLSQSRVKELGWGSPPPEESVKISTWRPSPLMPNPRILDGSQTRPDGNTWLDDPFDYSTFRMSFDSDEDGWGDIVLLLILTKVPDEAELGSRKTYCGLILEALGEPARKHFKRAGIFEFNLDRRLRPDRSNPPAWQHSSVLQFRDYSCMWRMEHAPVEDLTII